MSKAANSARPAAPHASARAITLWSYLFPPVIVLDPFHYLHLQDQRSGQLALVEGPKKFSLRPHQFIVGDIREKCSLTEGEYVVVLNPFDPAQGKILEGERQVRVGPAMFALHPGERIEPDDRPDSQGEIRREFVLTEQQGLLLYAERDAPHPVTPDQPLRAGQEFLLKGPCRYIPHKNMRVVCPVASLHLAEGSGTYIQDKNTGAVQLVKGPVDFFLEPHQAHWEKPLSQEEMEALGYVPQNFKDKSIRMLSAEPKRRDTLHDAVIVSLEGNEAIYLYDSDKVRVVFGPRTVFLEPNERPKVLHLSGGVPITPNIIRVAKLNLGPEYFRDRVMVRTRDNATLELEIAYRWRFEVDPARPEKLFALKDFIGFVAQTLSAEIRGEAARHDFDRFHAEAGMLVTRVLFGEGTTRPFSENGLVIFGADVEKITPKEDKISERLATAILSNVEIITETTRKKAEIERERELLAGNALKEEQRRALLSLELENDQRRILAEAETAAEKARLEAQVKADVARINAQAQAEATRLQEQARIEMETARMRSLIELLETPGGKAYIQLEQARILRAADKVIVPTDARIYLGKMGEPDAD